MDVLLEHSSKDACMCIYTCVFSCMLVHVLALFSCSSVLQWFTFARAAMNLNLELKVIIILLYSGKLWRGKTLANSKLNCEFKPSLQLISDIRSYWRIKLW